MTLIKSRLDYLDALRGIAIVGVIIAHTGSIAATSSAIGHLAARGSYGVQLFFVISAFTIFLTYERAALSEHHPTKNFFIRRLLRIIPIYWMGIILYTVVYGLNSRGWLPGPKIWHYPLHLALVNLLHPETSSSVVPGGWSISCEVLFYLTVPIWFMWVKNLRSSIIFVIACCIVGPLLTEALRHTIGSWTAQFGPEADDQFYYRIIFNQMPCFSFGILTYFILKNPPNWLIRLQVVKYNLVGLFVTGVLFIVAMEANLRFIGSHILFSAAFSSLALVLSQLPWAILVNPVSRFLGKISYSTYLLHFLVLKQLTLILPMKLQQNQNSYFFILLLCCLLITIPLAYVSFKLIETRFARLAKSIIVKSENRRMIESESGALGSTHKG